MGCGGSAVKRRRCRRRCSTRCIGAHDGNSEAALDSNSDERISSAISHVEDVSKKAAKIEEEVVSCWFALEEIQSASSVHASALEDSVLALDDMKSRLAALEEKLCSQLDERILGTLRHAIVPMTEHVTAQLAAFEIKMDSHGMRSENRDVNVKKGHFADSALTACYDLWLCAFLLCAALCQWSTKALTAPKRHLDRIFHTILDELKHVSLSNAFQRVWIARVVITIFCVGFVGVCMYREA